MAQGKLITFEGIDGSGKSTQAQLLYERLRSEKISCALFREPGGTSLGEQVRNILLNQPEKMGAEAELLLFSAARGELVRQIIKPLLKKDCLVILDRFVDSTTAYQGYGRGIGLEAIRAVNNVATQGVAPLMTFLFDIDSKIALSRHTRDHDRMEQEGIAFMEKVRQGYLAVANSDATRVSVLDGTKSIEELRLAVWESVSRLFE